MNYYILHLGERQTVLLPALSWVDANRVAEALSEREGGVLWQLETVTEAASYEPGRYIIIDPGAGDDLRHRACDVIAQRILEGKAVEPREVRSLAMRWAEARNVRVEP